MKETAYFTSFTVTGSGPFPMDMLRYDQAWPMTTEDAQKITQSFDDPAGMVKWEVRLTMAQKNKLAPTLERWKSFCCKVTEVT